jgi:hypothetical protein
MKSLHFFENHPFIDGHRSWQKFIHNSLQKYRDDSCMQKNHSFWSTLNIYLFSSFKFLLIRKINQTHLIFKLFSENEKSSFF